MTIRECVRSGPGGVVKSLVGLACAPVFLIHTQEFRFLKKQKTHFLAAEAIVDQCNRKTPSTARSSAGLISLECGTVTANSGPSSFRCQKARKSCSAGKFGNIS